MNVVLAAVCAGLVMIVVGMARADSPSAEKDQLLISAAEGNDVESVKRLLREGAGVQARDQQGRTA